MTPYYRLPQPEVGKEPVNTETWPTLCASKVDPWKKSSNPSSSILTRESTAEDYYSPRVAIVDTT